MKLQEIFKDTKAGNMREDAREALDSAGFSRRDVIKGMGALVVGFSSVAAVAKKLNAEAPLPSPFYDTLQVDSWIAIASDESITAYSGKCDMGQGFRWQDFQELDPARAFDSHGRGILLAKWEAFHRLEYQGDGSKVRMEIRLP